jgi:hypothetical protein
MTKVIRRGKLDPDFEGPFEVVRVLPNGILVKQRGKEKLFHPNRLRKVERDSGGETREEDLRREELWGSPLGTLPAHVPLPVSLPLHTAKGEERVTDEQPVSLRENGSVTADVKEEEVGTVEENGMEETRSTRRLTTLLSEEQLREQEEIFRLPPGLELPPLLSSDEASAIWSGSESSESDWDEIAAVGMRASVDLETAPHVPNRGASVLRRSTTGLSRNTAEQGRSTKSGCAVKKHTTGSAISGAPKMEHKRRSGGQ